MAASENIVVQQEDSKAGIGQRLWDFLTKPANAITDRAERRQARTLAAFLFVFYLLTAVRLVVGLISGSYLEEPEPYFTVVILNVLILISYGLSRTKRYYLGSGLAVISTILIVILSVVLRGDYEAGRIFSSMMWLVAALLLGSAFFSWRTMLGVSFFTLGIIMVLPLVVPGIRVDAIANVFSILFVVSFLIVLVGRFRDQLESDRQIELNAANQELEQSQVLLEQRVQERTQALQLAAEISRVLSQITDTESLLLEAVETIRSQFNFYYVQIYLVDAASNTLTLQAGTGNVGRELVRVGHRLIIGAGSINGAAAADKQAIIVSDTATSPIFRPNAYLPRTRSEMSVPLLIGNRVVGVLDLQSAESGSLTADNLPAFEAMAGQLAVAIENAKLLSDAAEARAEVESFTRRITREGWNSYLDAVAHPRFMGFSYDSNTVTPLNTPLSQESAEGNVAQVAIDVVGETVGAIQIVADDDHIWTADDLDLIQDVATQVGQQVEMLRSLDEAAQYRQEAERALRRVTHEAWLTYEQSPDLAGGFTYNQLEVTPVTAVSSPTDSPDIIHHNLAIHGEAVGELAITKSDQMDEAFADELVTAVASQLITHMENLRLTEQTEKALADSQRRGYELSVINAVAEASADLSNVTDFLEAIQHQLEEAIPMNSFTTSTYEKADNMISFAYAYDEKNGKLENSPPIQLQPYHLSYKTIHEAVPQIIHFTEEEVAEQRRNRPPNMMSEDASLMASLLFVPLVSGQDVVGIISTQSYNYNVYTQEHISLLTGVAGYVTTAIQKARLFEQTQARAEELAVINEVAQIVAQETDRLKLLTAVHDQIQRIMTVDSYFVALYHEKTNTVEYPYAYDDNRVFSVPSEPLDEKSKMNQVIKTAKPIYFNWTQEEITEMREKDEMTYVGDNQSIPASLIFVPLLLGQDVLGVLSVQANGINTYNQADVDLLSGIANHVALSLENNRLLTETRQAAEREQRMREISATINTAIDAESVLQTAAREIGRAIGVETYVYLTPDKNVIEPTANEHGKQTKNGTAL